MTRDQLRDATLTIAAGHAFLAALLITGHAGYGRRADGPFPDAAEHPLWIVIHAGVALLIVLSIFRYPRLKLAVMSLSAGAMLCWSTLMWVWAIHLDPDATWAVATLGVVLGLASLTLSGLWADRID